MCHPVLSTFGGSGRSPTAKIFSTWQELDLPSRVEDSRLGFNAKILCGQVEKVVSGVA